MAGTSNSPNAGTRSSDPFPGCDQDSDAEFWYNMYASNQDDDALSSDQAVAGSSRLDYEWGYVYDKSRKTKKKRKMDVGSSSSTVNSVASDVSEALTAISTALSLSSSSASSSSSSRNSGQRSDEDKEKEDCPLLSSLFAFQGEGMDGSIKKHLSFDIQSLSLKSNDNNGMLSSDGDGDEKDIQATSNFDASEERQKDDFQVPKLGMVFSSEAEGYNFYKSYADKIGFSIRKGKVQRLCNGTIRKRYFFCSREGFRSEKQSNKITQYKRKETRTGCNAKIQYTVENGKWVISKISYEHNHPLENQWQMKGLCSKISDAELMIHTKNDAEIAKDAQATKCTDFCNTDCSMHVNDKKINCLQSKDAQRLLNYLKHLQVDDLSFFYAVQLDSGSHITNFFWRDGRSKVDYDYFGDVLILDTTFRVDKYDMICAPFLGVNHHQQYVLFGCAFLLDISTDSFVWLFKTFMEAMGRHQPQTIITDESQAIVDAINVVLPEAQHRIGMWYILQNALKHLPSFSGQPVFDSLFTECISGCQTEEEFESRWNSLLEQFKLCENGWLNNLYKSRERWAHIFGKNKFCAGIQYRKNTKNIFQNVTSETISPSQFVQQYLRAAETQRMDELREDFRSRYQAILTGFVVEEHAADIYTPTIFKAFQDELVKCLSLKVEEMASDGMIFTFKLTEESQKESFVVFHHSDFSVACSCKKYESMGILCAHALRVLNARHIFLIPSRYILKRWTKSAKNGVMANDNSQEMADKWQPPVSLLMHKTLNLITKSVALEKGRKIAEHYVDKALKKVEDVLKKDTGHFKTRKRFSRQRWKRV